MARKEIVIQHKLGLHARPAAAFVKLARQFAADVFIEKNGERVNGKSIMGVMMLAIGRGETVALEALGPDEAHALNELTAFLENGVGDDG
jgi:phosphotransferase system HPr (HPr) family protein